MAIGAHQNQQAKNIPAKRPGLNPIPDGTGGGDKVAGVSGKPSEEGLNAMPTVRIIVLPGLPRLPSPKDRDLRQELRG